MNLALSPTQSNVMTALRGFLLTVLPSGNAIFKGQISGTILTVTSVTSGTLSLGDSIVGPMVAPGTIIQAFGTGTGTTGNYQVSIGQTVLPQTLSSGVPVFQGQVNRVVESPSPDYCVMWPIMRERIETNIDTWADAKFIGSISGTTMTITQEFYGSIRIGSPVFGVGIIPGTKVIKVVSGIGGVGEYIVAPSQNVSSRAVACGTQNFLQPTKVTVQIDVHGPNASDNAQIISTMFRDAYAVEIFQASGYDVAPLHADDPKQVPFQNAEEQWETRYSIDAVMQANQTVVAGLQYADALAVDLINVEATYTP